MGDFGAAASSKSPLAPLGKGALLVVGGRAMGALPKLYRPPALGVFRLLPPVPSRPPASPTHAHTKRIHPLYRRVPGRCERFGSVRMVLSAWVPCSEAHAT